MTDGTTPNFNLVLIQIGGSRDSWGDKINENSTAIDAALQALSTSLGGKLNSATYTSASVLSKLLSVDGADSGLDADLLDGNEAVAFLQFGAPGLQGGKIYLTAAGAADPTANPGDIWLGY